MLENSPYPDNSHSKSSFIQMGPLMAGYLHHINRWIIITVSFASFLKISYSWIKTASTVLYPFALSIACSLGNSRITKLEVGIAEWAWALLFHLFLLFISELWVRSSEGTTYEVIELLTLGWYKATSNSIRSLRGMRSIGPKFNLGIYIG